MRSMRGNGLATRPSFGCPRCRRRFTFASALREGRKSANVHASRGSSGEPPSAKVAMSPDIVSRPPPHGSISDWLGTEMVTRLLNFAQTSRDQFKASDVGYGESNRVDPARRRSSKLKQLGELENELQACAQAALPSMFEHLGYELFDPASIELEMVAHGDGAFFLRHADTVIRREMTSYRAISAVYYFHRLPKSFAGGVLRLHSIGSKKAHLSTLSRRTTG